MTSINNDVLDVKSILKSKIAIYIAGQALVCNIINKTSPPTFNYAWVAYKALFLTVEIFC